MFENIQSIVEGKVPLIKLLYLNFLFKLKNSKTLRQQIKKRLIRKIISLVKGLLRTVPTVTFLFAPHFNPLLVLCSVFSGLFIIESTHIVLAYSCSLEDCSRITLISITGYLYCYKSKTWCGQYISTAVQEELTDHERYCTHSCFHLCCWKAIYCKELAGPCTRGSIICN